VSFSAKGKKGFKGKDESQQEANCSRQIGQAPDGTGVAKKSHQLALMPVNCESWSDNDNERKNHDSPSVAKLLGLAQIHACTTSPSLVA